MIDTECLRRELTNRPEYIGNILNDLGYTPYERADYFHFANLDGNNKSACVVWKNNLAYKNYTRSGRDGDLFTLIMHDKNCGFPDAIRYIGRLLGLKNIKKRKVELPFGGFFKRICSKKNPRANITVYDKDVFVPYSRRYNKQFFRDGVDYLTQEKFDLGYSEEDHCILIPLHTLSGELCGIKARNNDPACETSKRWWAFKPFSKNFLYGADVNYKDIVEKGIAVLVEAEKSVMQAYSFGFKNCLGVGGHKLTSGQMAVFKNINPKRIVIAYDEGIAESDLLAEALDIKEAIPKSSVGYIYDRENSLLKKKSKDSPTDIGKKGFKDLLKTHVVWCDGG